MPHPRNAGYRRGENWQCCPVCGFEYRASDFRRRWDGLVVCKYDWEPRHPQDFLKVSPDDMTPAVQTGACCDDGSEIDLSPCGEIFFVNTEYTTDAALFTVHVKRENGSKDPVILSYTTADDTAIAGTNYTETSGTLTWEEGEEGVKSISIPIIEGEITEVSFTVNVELVSGCVTFINNQTTVTIPAVDAVDAFVSLSADQTTSGDLEWDVAVYDNGGWWDENTNPERLTVPEGVSYVRVYGNASTITGQSTEMDVWHLKNGSKFIGGGEQHSLTVTTDHANISSGPVQVVEGDYFTQRVGRNSEETSWMAIERINPNTKMALVYKSEVQTALEDDPTTLTFDSVVFDTADFFEAPDTKFVVPAGVSAVQVFASASNNGTSGAFTMYITLNGQETYGCPKKTNLSFAEDYLSLASATLLVSEGDEIQVVVVQAGNDTEIQVNSWMSILQVPGGYAKALVYKSESQTAGFSATAEWGEVVYDTAGLVTSDTTFTIPAGYTQARVAVNAEFDPGAGGQMIIDTNKNGVTFTGRAQEHSEVTGLEACGGVSAWVNVEEGDEFTVVAAGNNGYTWFPNTASWFFIEVR